MDNNYQNDNIETLDVDNNQIEQQTNNINTNNTVTINGGEKTVNTTINPNAYHPSMNQKSSNQNTQSNINNPINNQTSSVYRIDTNDDYNEAPANLVHTKKVSGAIFYIMISIIPFLLIFTMFTSLNPDSFFPGGFILKLLFIVGVISFIVYLVSSFKLRKYETNEQKNKRRVLFIVTIIGIILRIVRTFIGKRR